MGDQRTRWGFIGSGSIARAFAEGLRAVPGAELVAVWSPTAERAQRFAAAFGARPHATCEGLVEDPEVDVVYVASPHSAHMENSLAALNAGKPVLCEKPFCINAAQAEAVITAARAKGLFLMEAMWTRFFPLMATVREMIANGAIGEVRIVAADFGFRADFDAAQRLFNPALGGGALLDVGVYPVSFASMLLGAPSRIAGMAHLGESGVDEQSAVILGHERGALAICYAAARTNTAQEATVMGSDGRIRIHSEWWHPGRMTLTAPGKPDEGFEFPVEGNGYNYEAVEVIRCLREGRLESPVMPLDETLSIMRTLDQVRAQWGLRYLGE